MYKYTAKNLKPTVITSEIILYNFVFLIHLKEKKIYLHFLKLKKKCTCCFSALKFSLPFSSPLFGCCPSALNAKTKPWECPLQDSHKSQPDK